MSGFENGYEVGTEPDSLDKLRRENKLVMSSADEAARIEDGKR